MVEFTISRSKLGQYSLNTIYAGKHWSKRNSEKEDWRQLVFAEMLSQKVPRKIIDGPVDIAMRFNTKMDIDNHAYIAKMIIDSLKGYLIADDDRKHVKRLTMDFHDGNGIIVQIGEVS